MVVPPCGRVPAETCACSFSKDSRCALISLATVFAGGLSLGLAIENVLSVALFTS